VGEEFWPESAHDKNVSSLNRCDASIKQLKRAGIGPLDIRDFEDYRLCKRDAEKLSAQRSDREIPLPMRRQIWR
jgi:hypothetical protein